MAFALAQNFAGLLISRILIGVGVSACLMGPLTGYRIWFADEYQQRESSWMLMIASTSLFSALPVNFITNFWLEMDFWRNKYFNIFYNINIIFIPSWKKK